MSQPKEVHIATNVDWQLGMVTFKELSENGISLLNQPEIQVPLALLVRIVAQAMERTLPPGIREMNFLDAPRPVPPPRDRRISFGTDIGHIGPKP